MIISAFTWNLSMQKIIRSRALVGALTLLLSSASFANDGPPMTGGVISNPTLVKNQDVAKAQAAGVITTFMNKGATTCDADGKNCHSLFGSDDTPDYTTLQQSGQSLTGVSTFSFMDGNGDSGGDSNSVASQMGTLALACGDTGVKKVAGIAVRFTNCAVNANGDAQVTVQVCSAPSRSNPITAPENQVVCSNDPTAANFRAPTGYVCKRPACDTEPVGSLDGWSAPQTVSWQANLPTSASADQKTKNGLGMVFYPALNGTTPSFTADSDNMTAVKIVQSFVNAETNRTAVGVKIAYRHKTVVTKEMMVAGPSSVPNPGAHTAQWDTILKLQGNEKIPQYQQQYAKNGTECLQQIQGGIASDGKITVCDPNYTNESGIKPLQKTATVAVEGQECGTVPQCLSKVVNTTTWKETCSAEVPMAMRSCTTKQDYTMEKLSMVRTRTQEACHESRNSAEYGCATSSGVSNVASTLTCVPKSFRCNADAQECCTFEIACGADQSVTVTYKDCCGYTQVKSANNITDFLGAGFQYNWNTQSRIHCTTDGYCSIDFTNYSCADPTQVVGYDPNVNQFAFGIQYHATYSTYNSCGAYEAAR